MTVSLLSTIIGSLLFATAIIEGLRMIRPSKELETVRTRLRTWWCISLVLIATVATGSWAIHGLIFLLLLQSFRELLVLPVSGTAATALLLLYGIVILPAGLFSLAVIGDTVGDSLLAVFFLTALNDIFQYLSGKAFGKRKLAPVISPNKTWEGFLGGVIATAVASVFFTLFESALFGAAVSLFGTIGDLAVSTLKRAAKVKDTGTFLPGHGGILDRLDSLVTVAPFVLAWLRFKN